MGDDEIRNQWHAPFCSAMRLEFLLEGKRLEFLNEYNLSAKPLQVDLLIISKKMQREIENEIGKIFRRHNLIEYKSPDDKLNEDTYYKVLAYACLYKALHEKNRKVKEGDITITFIREGYPRALMKYFTDHGFQVEEESQGIYYIQRDYHFPMQVIVSRKLKKKDHIWLTSLTEKLSEADARTLALETNVLKTKYERAHAEAVLGLAMDVNEAVFRKIINNTEDGAMCCEAIRKFFQPELDEKDRIISEKDQALSEKDQALSEKDQVISEKDQALNQKDEKIVTTIEKLVEFEKFSLSKACDFCQTTVEEYQKMKESISAMMKTA